MPKAVRAVFSGCAHPVMQRGSNRRDVRFVDADRQVYLGYLQDAAARFDLRAAGCCLMTNHVHLGVTPREQKGSGLHSAITGKWEPRIIPNSRRDPSPSPSRDECVSTTPA